MKRDGLGLGCRVGLTRRGQLATNRANEARADVGSLRDHRGGAVAELGVFEQGQHGLPFGLASDSLIDDDARRDVQAFRDQVTSLGSDTSRLSDLRLLDIAIWMGAYGHRFIDGGDPPVEPDEHADDAPGS